MRINEMGKRLLALALCLALLCTTAFAADIPEPPDSSCVLDEAGVLSASTEEKLNQMFDQLKAAGSGEIAVVTVDFTGSRSTADFAVDTFNEWGVGDRDKDNGVLLLLVIGAEDYYCQLGEKLDSHLTAGTLDDMLYRYLEPDFAVGDYDLGTLKFMSAIYEELEAIYGEAGPLPEAIPQTGYNPNWEAKEEEDYQDGFRANVFWQLLLVGVVLIVVMAVNSSIRRGRYGSAYYAARRGSRIINDIRRSSYASRSGYSGSSHSGYRPSRSSHSSSSSRSRSFGGGSSRGSGAGRRTGGGRRR